VGRRLKASNPTKATSHKPQPVEVRNIAHPGVWQTAMKIAEGDTSRLKVVSMGRVDVMPKP
jgi:hypothetical protein